MSSPLTVIIVVCLYMSLLFGVARWAEQSLTKGRSLVDNPLIYTLSLALYCTTWTYYGSVGLAATSGMLFMSVYLGPTMVAITWWALLRKMVRLKRIHRITSIADFIASRYGKSRTLAAVATVIALVGSTPYVALQLKAVITSFEILTNPSVHDASLTSSYVEPVIVCSMILFTIVFGVRRLDPTERHQGMVMAVAVASLVKIILFMVAGVFVVYFVYGGLDDIFAQAVQRGLTDIINRNSSFATWCSWLILSMSAVMFLPRQFHISVVENVNEQHIRTAMWLFPFYLLLITLFAWPIALAGLISGRPISEADYYVLTLPISKGEPFLPLLVFLGGFSAASGMIMISAMTIATMTSNHLLLPLFGWIRGFGFLRRHLLGCRWTVVAGFIFLGYLFQSKVGESYMLVNMGVISFAAALQFAPPIVGGIYWAGANRAGALLGLTSGFAVWAYTMLLPSLVKSGWMSSRLLQSGPWGLEWLNPERLLGVSRFDPVTHTVFWSLTANVGLFVLGSILFEPSKEDASLAEQFVGVMSGRRFISRAARREGHTDLKTKKIIIKSIFAKFFDPEVADEMTRKAIRSANLEGKKWISIMELAGLSSQVEKFLSGSIGSAAAHHALEIAGLFTPDESKILSEIYGEMLAESRAGPNDLRRRIDFYRERQTLITTHAAELEKKVRELEQEISRREAAEAQLMESEERYRTAIESSSDGVGIIREDDLTFVNRKFANIFGYEHPEALLGGRVSQLVHPDDRARVMEMTLRRQRGEMTPTRYDFKGLKKDGRIIYVEISATKINYQGEALSLAFLRDVTERRQAENEIRRLSRRLIASIEDERKRLAVDLHD
ncbi:MAG: PAS domain S-box protein, partial [Deltaproteobacteria bacterium]|nr:PAS domain S-box protein [Deltaproteobacteria bacterium]